MEPSPSSYIASLSSPSYPTWQFVCVADSKQTISGQRQEEGEGYMFHMQGSCGCAGCRRRRRQKRRIILIHTVVDETSDGNKTTSILWHFKASTRVQALQRLNVCIGLERVSGISLPEAWRGHCGRWSRRGPQRGGSLSGTPAQGWNPEL